MLLEKKYVFHIPVHKFEDNRLIPLNISDVVDRLIDELNQNGYTSLYMTNVKGYYKSRCFDELLITLFVSPDDVIMKEKEFPDIIFKRWFEENNYRLQQESFAYEEDNKMLVERLMD